MKKSLPDISLTQWVIGLWIIIMVALAVGVFSHFTSPTTTNDRLLTLEPSGPLVPNVVFTNENGIPVNLRQWRGKAVLVNVWATWCAPCIKEMPALDRLQSFFSKDQFEVIAVSVDRGGRDTVRDFFAAHNLKKISIYSDNTGGILRALKIRSLPTTLIISANGEEVGRQEGDAPWDTPHMRDLITSLLGSSIH